MEPANTMKANRPAGRYGLLLKQAQALLEGENDWVANLSNIAALLSTALPQINWVGFYRMKGGELLLGPFQGKPACVHISVGKGVCGTAVQRNATQVIPDVRCFPGHIACDCDSVSELVVPLRARGRIVGVLDIDSPRAERFGDADARAMEAIADLVSRSCAWDG